MSQPSKPSRASAASRGRRSVQGAGPPGARAGAAGRRGAHASASDLIAETRWGAATDDRWIGMSLLWSLGAMGMTAVTIDAGLREMWPILLFWALMGVALGLVAARADRGIRVDESGIRVLRRLGSAHVAWDAVAAIEIGEQVEHAETAQLLAGVVGLAVGGVPGAGIGSDLAKAAALAVAHQSRRHAPASIEDAIDQLGEDRPGLSPTLAVHRIARGSDRRRALRCDGPMGWEFARAVAIEALARGIEVRVA